MVPAESMEVPAAWDAGEAGAMHNSCDTFEGVGQEQVSDHVP